MRSFNLSAMLAGASLSGITLNSSPIGATTPSTGVFTTLTMTDASNGGIKTFALRNTGTGDLTEVRQEMELPNALANVKVTSRLVFSAPSSALYRVTLESGIVEGFHLSATGLPVNFTCAGFGLGVSDFGTSGANAKFAISAGHINLDDTYALAWGGGTGRTSILGSKSASSIQYTATTHTFTGLNPIIILKSDDAGSSSEPTLNLFRNSATPANFDQLGQIRWTGLNSSLATVTYADIRTMILDVTAGSDTAALFGQIRNGATGNLEEVFRFDLVKTYLYNTVNFADGTASVSASTPSTHKLAVQVAGATYYVLLSNV